MSTSDRNIPVAVLGATGMVGQKFIQLLEHHPWFSVCAVAASPRSADKPYDEAVNWKMDTPIPEAIAKMVVQPCEPTPPCRVVFSGLDATVAGDIEEDFAKMGYAVISNARNHRMRDEVPLLVSDVNSAHLELIKKQGYPDGGMIVTNPNCAVAGLVVALKPLHDLFGLTAVHVVTQQAVSGAGYPGVASLDILGNVIPFISGEEPKIETEPAKILGELQDDKIANANFPLSATATRVPVTDGHLECVSVKLANNADHDTIIAAWEQYQAVPQQLQLPSAPLPSPLIYCTGDDEPQPKRHRNLRGGMAVSVGRLRPCPVLGWKFIVMSHNTVRGAAGGAILNAELIAEKGYLE